MQITLLTAILFFGFSATAQQACFETEKDVSTKKMFTEDDWQTTLTEWDNQEPENPGWMQLFSAYQLYKQELPIANKYKGDKRKHCYMGCRLAQDISYEAAVYAAWYKEKEDLTDCVKGTYFELRDFDITVQGAELGATNSDPQFCLDECSGIKRY